MKSQLKTTMTLEGWKNRQFSESHHGLCNHFVLCQRNILTRQSVLFLQIQELVEAIVLPMTHKERFQKLGIRPPKGVLLYGPPGTGKTLMARACAAQTNATFLKLAGPQLVQVLIFYRPWMFSISNL